MIFLYILGGLVALIVFLLFLPLHLTVSYDGELKLNLRVLFVRVDLTKKLLSRKTEKPAELPETTSEQTEKQSLGEKINHVTKGVT